MAQSGMHRRGPLRMENTKPTITTNRSLAGTKTSKSVGAPPMGLPLAAHRLLLHPAPVAWASSSPRWWNGCRGTTWFMTIAGMGKGTIPKHLSVKDSNSISRAVTHCVRISVLVWSYLNGYGLCFHGFFSSFFKLWAVCFELESLETGPTCQEWVQELLIVQVSKKYYSLSLFVVLFCLHYPCFYKVQKMEACFIISQNIQQHYSFVALLFWVNLETYFYHLSQCAKLVVYS
jgi:hypothetical protein